MVSQKGLGEGVTVSFDESPLDSVHPQAGFLVLILLLSQASCLELVKPVFSQMRRENKDPTLPQSIHGIGWMRSPTCTALSRMSPEEQVVTTLAVIKGKVAQCQRQRNEGKPGVVSGTEQASAVC